MWRQGWVLRGAIIALMMMTLGCSRKTAITPGPIVFLGDSITTGYELDPGQAYPALIRIEGMSSVNLGVSGSETADGLQRLRDYFQTNDKPRLVVIALGANDLLHGIPMEMTRANLESAVRECQRRGIPVLLCGIRIPGKFTADEVFEEVAGATKVPLLPNLLQGVLGNESLMQDDHMHPNAAGQKVVAGNVEAALRRSFSFRSE